MIEVAGFFFILKQICFKKYTGMQFITGFHAGHMLFEAPRLVVVSLPCLKANLKLLQIRVGNLETLEWMLPRSMDTDPGCKRENLQQRGRNGLHAGILQMF